MSISQIGQMQWSSQPHANQTTLTGVSEKPLSIRGIVARLHGRLNDLSGMVSVAEEIAGNLAGQTVLQGGQNVTEPSPSNLVGEFDGQLERLDATMNRLSNALERIREATG